MITEFTCGIYSAIYASNVWNVRVNRYTVATIHPDGKLMQCSEEYRPLLSVNDLIEIAVLMNNIKRQYKQLQK